MTEAKKMTEEKKVTKKTTAKTAAKTSTTKKTTAAKTTAKKSSTKTSAKTTAKKPVAKAKKVVAGDKVYATGKRKDAVARVWLRKGTGKITIKGTPAREYLKRDILEVIINQPFVATETVGQFDVVATCAGGGLTGQAGALRHGISKCLAIFNEEAYRSTLRQNGFLTRDPRVVERKKPGRKKARKGRTYRKR